VRSTTATAPSSAAPSKGIATSVLSNPIQIAVALIVENAGWGAGAAAPIARRVFDYWLLNQYPSEADLAAIQQGKAAAPIGKPRVASEVAWPAANTPSVASTSP